MLRLSDDARRAVLDHAAEEARRRGDRRIGTGHLLLGLLHDPTGEPARVLGANLASARAADESLDRAALLAVGVAIADPAPPSAGPSAGGPAGRLPLTSGARAAFQQAIVRARSRPSGHLQTRHILLALLDRARPDPAAELLRALEVDVRAVRTQLLDDSLIDNSSEGEP